MPFLYFCNAKIGSYEKTCFVVVAASHALRGL